MRKWTAYLMVPAVSLVLVGGTALDALPDKPSGKEMNDVVNSSVMEMFTGYPPSKK